MASLGAPILLCLLLGASWLGLGSASEVDPSFIPDQAAEGAKAHHVTGANRRLLQQSTSACTAAGQFVADPSSDCTHYWQCTGSGQGYYMSCGAGTAFNDKCACCDFPSNFACGSGGGTPATTPSPPTTPTTPSGGGGWQSSTATYYNPAGGYGACGTVLQDSDMIVALGVQALGSSSYPYPNCGKCIQVRCVGSTNSVQACRNSNIITVRVADRCQACASDGHLDLSQGAFQQIADTAAGVIRIEYQYVNSGC